MSSRPLRPEDAGALIRMTAVLEGHLLIGELDPHVVDALVRHLNGAGLLEADAGRPELRLALADLNQRIRYAAGEYDEPPTPDDGAADQRFGFSSPAAALAFADACAAEGEAAAAPVAVDGRAYDGDVGWEVAVRTTELPLSAEFDEHVRRLTALAATHGGTPGGWASVPPVS
jgi:hypothetical protein